MKTASRIFIALFVFLALAGLLLTFSEGGLKAQTLTRPEAVVQTTVTASEPVTAVLSQPVRNLPTNKDELFLDREINPLRNPGLFQDDLGLTGTDTAKQDPLAHLSQIDTGFTPTPLFDFEGLGTDGFAPPDTNGDVGPNHYIQMVNVSFAIFDKSGNIVQGDTLFTDLFAGSGLSACENNNDGDPIVVYDDLADRWLLSQFVIAGDIMCIAISTTSDPTGTYWLYQFTLPDFPDYFKFGVWPDAYYMGTNTGFPNQYYAYAFDRNSMLNGSPATFQFSNGHANFLLPADLDGANPPPAGDPGYFYTMYSDGYPNHPAGVDRIALYEFDVDWNTPGNSTFGLSQELPIAAYNYTVCGFFVQDCIPQPGTSQTLDSLSYWPMFRFAYRNLNQYEAMVGNFTVDLDGTDKAAIRWFELQRNGGAGSWTLAQEGTHAPDGDHRWMGSIAMDGSGNIALGYSVSSSSTIPAIRYATRLRTDAPGTLQAEASLIEGGGVQTGIFRWGDYSAMSVDPADDCTFWYTTQYHDSNDTGFNWNTRVGVFRIPECTGVLGASGVLDGRVTEVGSGDPIEGANISATNGYTLTGGALTNMSGDYRAVLAESTYTVTASAFGYQPAEVTAVSIVSGTTTTVDFVLNLATYYTVEGTVTDVNTGWPLYARIDIDGYPGDAIWTNPETGYYSISLPEGIEYTFNVEAWVDGYLDDSRDVGPLTGNTVEDFTLDVNVVSCTAPGYGGASGSTIFADDFEAGLGNWTATGLWHQESQTATCGSLVAPFPSPTNDAYFGQAGVCNYDIGLAQGSLTMNSPAAIPASGALLRVWSYEETECGGNCTWDKRFVEISTNGSSWSELGQGGTEGVWYQQTYDLSSYANQNIWLRFRFDSVDDFGNDFFGWMIDNVDVSVPSCVPTPGGGLVVGNVYDGASTALNGATVQNETGEAVSTYSTPSDPNVDDGFYTIFSDGGSQDHWASYTSDYGVDLETVNVVVSDTVSQDFMLASAMLTYSPPEIEETMSIGDIVTNTVTVTNTGTFTLDFTVRIGDFAGPGALMIRPHVEPVSVAPSNGRFPMGNYSPSVGLAPADGEAVVSSDAPIVRVPYGTTAYAVDAANAFYTAFDLDTPETLPNVAPFVISDFPGAGEVIDGFSYVIDANVLHQLDLATGAQVGTTPVTPPGGSQNYTGMALDPTTGDVYLSSCDISTSLLFTLDVVSGTATQVGTITNSPCTIGIAIDGAGDLYGYDIVTDSFLGIDKNTAAGTVIGSIGFDANFGQGMGYDAITDQIYLAAFNNGTFLPELRIADLTTGNTTLVGTLGSSTPGVLVQLPWLGTELSSGGGWAYPVPDSGTVPPMSTTTFDVVFDARSLYQVGDYTANLEFNGNFVNMVPTMPLTMHLSCPTCGFLEGDITDSVTTAPVDASINITNTSGFDVTLEGSSYAIAVPPGTYNLAVTAVGYVGETDSAVVTQGVTTTVDFALDPAISILSYSPADIEEFMEVGDIVTNTVTVTNSGYIDLEFTVDIGNYGGPLQIVRVESPVVAYVPPAAATSKAQSLQGAVTEKTNIVNGNSTVAPDVPGMAVLLDQQPNQVNGLFSDSDCGLCGTGAQSIAENFSLATSETIGQIIFWTGYFPGDVPIDPDLFTVIFHEDSGGFPGAAVYTESNVPYERVQTGVILFGVHEWLHTLTLDSPVTLGPGNYWVEIFNETIGSSENFFWETGNTDTIGNGLVGSVWSTSVPGSAWNFDGATELAVQLVTGSGGTQWASAVPDNGTVPPMSSVTFDVVFDARSLYQVGDYTAQLSFDGNFSNMVPTMPLTMHLSCPTCGFLEGDITDITTGAPLSADVHVTGPGGFDATVTGESYNLAVPPGSYDLTVSASGYLSDTATAVVTQGNTTITDFALWPIFSELSYTPDFFEQTVALGDVVTHTMTISNLGTVAFDFQLSDATKILLVDDDDNSPDVQSIYTSALDNLGYQYDVWDTGNSDNEPTASDLADYQMVIWFTGDEFGGAAGPGSAGEAAMASWLDGGNCLFLSSQDYYYDRGQTQFMVDYLGLASATSDVAQTMVTGAGSIFGGYGPYTLNYPITNYSDIINPNGTAELAFVGDQGNTAINKISDYLTTFWGFPWEALPSAADRESTLDAFIQTCGVSEAEWLHETPDNGTVAGFGGMMEVSIVFDATAVTQTGTYTGTIYFSGSFDNVVMPATAVMHVEELASGMEMSGDMAASGAPGDMVMYTLHITNTGNAADTYTLSLGTHAWTTTLPGGNSVALAAGASATFMVHVTIPANASNGDEDMVTVTATSNTDNTVTASADLTTTAVIPPPPSYTIYLPIILKP